MTTTPSTPATTYKHHYEVWRDVNGGLDDPDGEAHSKCARCNVTVKMGRKGGIKFLQPDGTWSSKRTSCPVPPKK